MALGVTDTEGLAVWARISVELTRLIQLPIATIRARFRYLDFVIWSHLPFGGDSD